MRKRVKIWYHSGTTSDIKEFSAPRPVYMAMLAFICLCALTFSYISYDYLKLKMNSLNTGSLGKTVDSLNQEIANQRTQIQSFASEIEKLKKQVGNLSSFEEKVRIIADIKQTSDSSGLLGIGSIPSDTLNPNIPLKQKHNSLSREMHQQISQTKTATEKHALDFDQLIKQLEQKRNILASTPSIRPTEGLVTSGFGNRISPFTGQSEFHTGLDISNAPGTKIIAPASGKVTIAGEKQYFGNLLAIDHDHGRVTQYGHLQEILVSPGQKVKRGDVIALVGNTGRSTGPHLHYEVLINGTPVNPVKYILN